MADDLVSAAALIGQKLIIITSQDPAIPPGLRENLLIARAPLTKLVGGALTSLHARTARHFLAETPLAELQAAVLRPRLATLLQQLGKLSIPQRSRMTDDQVRAFIKRSLGTDASCTALLEQLRASGRACEQRRFRDLYRTVSEAARVA